MAESKARITLKDVRASVKRMQTEGEKLVTRLQRDARAFATRSRRETVSSLLSDARRLQADLRKRAERAIEEIDTQRTRILATLVPTSRVPWRPVRRRRARRAAPVSARRGA